MPQDGIVYLIHLSRPYRHARHYLGWTSDLEQRLREHRAGRGSPLIAAAIAAGIDLELAATWPGSRHDERRRHRQKNSRARLCPICRAEARPQPAAVTAPGDVGAVDPVDEVVIATLGQTRQPVTLTALHAQLRHRGQRVGSLYGRLELLALRGRVTKTSLLDEIAWATNTATSARPNTPAAAEPARRREDT